MQHQALDYALKTYVLGLLPQRPLLRMTINSAKRNFMNLYKYGYGSRLVIATTPLNGLHSPYWRSFQSTSEPDQEVWLYASHAVFDRSAMSPLAYDHMHSRGRSRDSGHVAEHMSWIKPVRTCRSQQPWRRCEFEKMAMRWLAQPLESQLGWGEGSA